MEESKKYYTPSIEEFYVGFEFEENSDTINSVLAKGNIFEQEWWPRTLSLVSESAARVWSELAWWNKMIEQKCVRVKYLDKEDIESLGFSINYPNNYSGYEDFFNYFVKAPPYRLFVTYSKHKVKITLPLPDGKTLFEGIIRNKSELRKLMKQLNII